ncbi:helix-turn-helix transcriptional regulator [Tenacibaculum piscium]|uniref:helix-turn-helix transcriptional regulator n=1 Tax=Tenacibaculum piscium TaxID=1458515 RepID=UPI001EFBCC9C|nr:WYL domain-containing protein [Tenacibaculum piscium]MCG8182760.1 WYL domain-containing protein [Tenacibaculum piscium]MCG8204152.1 WYL domain-containing protein [Tenacibaculum piscium]
MSTNKHAIIRYQTLDKCFSNTGKRYYIEDLLEACNDAIFNFDAVSGGIKKRQLYDDIKFMESVQGWSIPLEKIKDGRRAFYRYENSSFSINNQPLNDEEAEQLKSAMLVLTRFKGLPQFEWIHELIPKLDKTFNLYNDNQEIISFDNNQFLKGTDFITPLFKAIQNKQTLIITYKSFKSDVSQHIIFHSYHLKQYNNRWFLFGKDNDYNNLMNLALDRIAILEQSSEAFDESQLVNFEEYFDDFIGVTKPSNAVLTHIRLKASLELSPYIITKPLHGSQKKVSESDNNIIFSIDVIPNFELTKLLLSFGNAITVIEPLELKNEIVANLNKNIANYN